MSRENTILSNIKRAIDKCLSTYSFNKLKNIDYTSGKTIEYWTKDLGWKLFEYKIIYPKMDTYFVDTDFAIFLKIGEEQILLDGKPVAKLAGRNKGRYYFPSFLRNFRMHGLVKEIVRDTEKAYLWFDNYDTPERCIHEIEAGNTQINKRISKNYDRVITFLKDLINK